MAQDHGMFSVFCILTALAVYCMFKFLKAFAGLNVDS